MKKTLFSFILIAYLFTLMPPLYAQTSIQWQKCLGGSKYEQATAIQQTSDNGYVITGYTQSHDGDVLENYGLLDFWVIKLSNSGSIEWQKVLGGGYIDWAYSIIQTIDGGYILVGFTESNDGNVSGNHGDKDAWIVKLSNTGNLEWQKAFGGSGWEEASSIQQTPDGGYIVAGRASSNDGDVSDNHGDLDFWILKLNSVGVIEWQKSLGGSNEDNARSIKLTSDGGYIVVGETKSEDGDVSGNNGNVDYWVVKLDNSGEIEWQNALGGLGLDAADDVVETVDGFVVCGYSGSYNNGDVTGNHGFFDSWVVKLSKTGDLMWQKSLGGSNADYGRSIVRTTDGMYVITGEAKSNNGDVIGNNGIQVAWVTKLNDDGELIWQKSLGGTDGEGSLSIQQTSDSGYIIAGYAWSNNGDVSGNHGEADFWVIKLSPESSPTSEIQPTQLQIYPNPAQQSISLKTTTGSTEAGAEPTLIVSITDLLGQELKRQTISNNEAVDIAAIPNGLYLVTATAASGKVYLGKMVKQE